MLNEDQRREKEVGIYEAVLTLLAQGEDLSALTVSQIAAAAGIGKGTVYEYFASKEDILHGLSYYCLDNELSLLDRALAPCRTLHDTEKALQLYIRELTQERIGRYHIVALVLAQSTKRLPAIQPDTVLSRIKGTMVMLFVRLREAGELAPDVEADYFVHVMGAAWLPFVAVLTPCRETRRLDPAAILARTCRMMEKALR